MHRMKPRVLFCDSARVWGGIEHWMVTVVGALAHRGWTTALVARTGHELLRRATAAGLETYGWRFRFDFDPGTILPADRLMRRWRPDLLVVALGRDIRTVGMAAHRQGVPMLWRMGMPYPNCGWAHRVTGKRLVRKVVVPSHELKGRLSPFPWLDGKVEVIPNGLPLTDPPDETRIAVARQALGWKRDQFVILWVGRIKAIKGVDLLLRAFAGLVAKHPHARIVLVGSGPDENALRELSVQLGIDARVRFAGYQSDPGPYYEGCDLFVCPSREEPFGWVLLEAMLRRKPVMAAAVGGIPEVAGDGAVRLFPKEDIGALRDILEELISDEHKRDRLADAGLARVRSTFTESLMMDRLEDCFTRTIDGSQMHHPRARSRRDTTRALVG